MPGCGLWVSDLRVHVITQLCVLVLWTTKVRWLYPCLNPEKVTFSGIAFSLTGETVILIPQFNVTLLLKNNFKLINGTKDIKHTCPTIILFYCALLSFDSSWPYVCSTLRCRFLYLVWQSVYTPRRKKAKVGIGAVASDKPKVKAVALRAVGSSELVPSTPLGKLIVQDNSSTRQSLFSLLTTLLLTSFLFTSLLLDSLLLTSFS